MTPMTSLFTESSDPLGMHLLDEHQRRYERVKRWREAQDNPHFTEVPVGWHQEFRRQTADGRRQQR